MHDNENMSKSELERNSETPYRIERKIGTSGISEYYHPDGSWKLEPHNYDYLPSNQFDEIEDGRIIDRYGEQQCVKGCPVVFSSNRRNASVFGEQSVERVMCNPPDSAMEILRRYEVYFTSSAELGKEVELKIVIVESEISILNDILTKDNSPCI